ncbi:MAG TPA: YggS family pyridoxal phosphate-dependent enzyme [Candidatus Polarisedimenticolaceae bacterium]
MSPDPALARALSGVRYRIAAACARARRDPAEVRLVAVSKTVPAARVRDLLACGQTVFGENRVQEALAKIPEVGAGASWHLVGHLQRNKARHAVGSFALIHSVDDLELAREIDRRAAARGIVQAVLVQLNLSGEATKSGAEESAVLDLIGAMKDLPHLDVRGLMTIPPPVEDAEASRPWFRRLRELRDRAAAATGLALADLSMGMTGDFEVAVEEGATLVRVGTALFGARG